MTTTDRCTCVPHYQDAGAGLTEYVPEWDPSCPEHGDIDHILEAGKYIDRRCREWTRAWCGWWTPLGGVERSSAQMRLLIERDQHRGECPGLSDCNGHPVPSVIKPFAWGSRDFEIYAARENVTGTFEQSLPEAMDAARALAVGS